MIMNEYVIYLLVIILSIAIQMIGIKYSIVNIMSLLLIVIAYILSIFIQNGFSLDAIHKFTGLDNRIIIITVTLFYGISSFSYGFFKLCKYGNEKKIKLADSIINRRIQDLLDNLRKKISVYTNLLGKDFFVSLYFVKGNIKKKVFRISYSGDYNKSLANWDGKVCKLKLKSIGRVIKSHKPDIVDFQHSNNKNEIEKLPNELQNWMLKRISYKITLPYLEFVKRPFVGESDETVIILTINCLDKTINWKKLSSSQNSDFLNIYKIFTDEAKEFYDFYEYY